MESNQNNPFTHTCRVYWEDTDGGAIVYYANYLKFAERARTEWLRALGFDQSKLRAELGVVFVVRDCQIRYKIPAKLDDLLTVTVAAQTISSHKIELMQRVLRGDICCAELVVELVVVEAETGRLVAIPPSVRAAIT